MLHIFTIRKCSYKSCNARQKFFDKDSKLRQNRRAKNLIWSLHIILYELAITRRCSIKRLMTPLRQSTYRNIQTRRNSIFLYILHKQLAEKKIKIHLFKNFQVAINFTKHLTGLLIRLDISCNAATTTYSYLFEFQGTAQRK